MQGFRAVTVLLSALLFLTAVSAFPVVESITGMFYNQGADMKLDAAEQAFGSNLKVEREGNQTYVFPEGIDTSKFEKSVFRLDRLESEGLELIVGLDREIEDGSVSELPGFLVSMERRGDIEIGGVLKASDSVAIRIESSRGGKVLERLGREASIRKGVPDGRVQALNLEANDAVDAPEARQSFDINGSGEKVAVLDTGVEASHIDFRDRIVERKDFTGDGVGDSDGHGTHVSGTVLGDGSADGGYYPGMAQEASLFSGKVLEGDGSGSVSDSLSAIEYAADINSSVISMSLGITSSDYVIDEYNSSIEYARDKGSVVVAAAGNRG
ncbi:MAG: S8 family peptidase, partial [Candidatus Nanohaloarchaea archaeon]